MNFRNKIPRYWLGGLTGAILIALLGLILLVSDSSWPRKLSSYSYNWLFNHISPPEAMKDSGVAIIYIDEQSLLSLNQPLDKPMDRELHATLLDRLKQDGARAVVMDIVFSDEGRRVVADQKFAEAIRSNGRVILGVDLSPSDQNTGGPATSLKRLIFPYSLFQQTNAHYGSVMVSPDEDGVVRSHLHYLDGRLQDAPASLSWAAAKLIGLEAAQDSAGQFIERWINYYGPPGTIPNAPYARALENDLPPGFFHDKVVFVGARPRTGSWAEKRDEFVSPYSAAGREVQFISGVEVHATQFLNLQRGDWLQRPSLITEGAILLSVAILFGFGLIHFRPTIATGIAVLGILAAILVVRNLFSVHHLWFSWLIIVVVQIPGALLYSIVFRSIEWYVQRRKLEEERRLANAQIHEQAALLDKAHDAILVHDLSWRAHYWNKSAAALYGWSLDEIRNLDLKSEVFKTDEAKLVAALEIALAQGEWFGELKQTTKSGAALVVQSRWSLVRDADGRPKSVLVINTDITEQKKLESQFLRTQRMESIGTLAGGIAHDLNNVLAPIMMGVEMMRMKSSDEFTNKMLSTMANSAKRGSDMVKQVLTFARGHEGERTTLQISHLVREMQKIVNETFPKSINFNSSIGESLWPILGDATQVHQIILNLCVNARDAMPDGGKIAVEVKNVTLTEEEAARIVGAHPQRYVLLSVTDNGTGIPPEIIDKIFEPFFTTKEIGKGTGLGLSTVISIIKSHGGFLDLKSQVGKGTSFNVYLPTAEAAAPPASAPVPVEALKGHGETILVVDDEPAVLELTRTMLAHYGYKVVTAMHGADALALFGLYKEKIKLVVMDMMMPVMDGATAIKALRKEQPALHFIAVSGLMQGDKLKEALGDDSVPFIPKPFASEKLLLALRSALGSKIIATQ